MVAKPIETILKPAVAITFLTVFSRAISATVITNGNRTGNSSCSGDAAPTLRYTKHVIEGFSTGKRRVGNLPRWTQKLRFRSHVRLKFAVLLWKSTTNGC